MFIPIQLSHLSKKNVETKTSTIVKDNKIITTTTTIYKPKKTIEVKKKDELEEWEIINNDIDIINF